MNRPRRGRPFAWGVAAACVYLCATVIAPHAPHARMLYDGLAPQPPYKWVKPPAGRGSDNEAPQPYRGTLPLFASGSAAAEFDTDDLQASVTLPKDAVEPKTGETAARVTLTPLDPASLAPAPAGRRFDGNAYRITGVYGASGRPLALRAPITIVLRYAVHATTILRLETAKDARGGTASSWTRLPTTVYAGSQEDLAHSQAFGAFVASNP